MPVFTDYNLQYNDPSQSAAVGFNSGLDARRQLLTLQAMQQELDQEQSFHNDFATLAQKKRPEARDFVDLMVRYPNKATQLRAGYEALADDQRSAVIGQAQPIYAALYNGRPDIAAGLAERYSVAAENGGDLQMAQNTKQLAQQIRQQPDLAMASLGMTLASSLGAERFGAVHKALEVPTQKAKGGVEFQRAQIERDRQAAQFERDLAEARTARANAANAAEASAADLRLKQAQAAKAEFDAQEGPQRAGWADLRDKQAVLEGEQRITGLRLDNEGKRQTITGAKLPESTMKMVNELTTRAGESEQLAVRHAQLADAFERQFSGSRLAGGAGAVIGEFLRRHLGTDSAASELRMRYQRLINSNVINSLPPGAASDRDIELAKQGFPSSTDDPALIVRFLRAQSNVARAAARVSSLQSDWVQQFGHLGRARFDGDVGGQPVTTGTTFNDFIKRVGGTMPGASTADTANLPEGKIAINRQTGQRLIVRNGQLVPLQ